jgi:hypothetical protein
MKRLILTAAVLLIAGPAVAGNCVYSDKTRGIKVAGPCTETYAAGTFTYRLKDNSIVTIGYGDFVKPQHHRATINGKPGMHILTNQHKYKAVTTDGKQSLYWTSP